MDSGGGRAMHRPPACLRICGDTATAVYDGHTVAWAVAAAEAEVVAVDAALVLDCHCRVRMLGYILRVRIRSKQCTRYMYI